MSAPPFTLRVASEVPIALVYNGVSHAVMLATPQDLEDFALGFSLSEGIVGEARQLYGVEVERFEAGIEAQISIASERMAALKLRRRSLTGRTGCGLCGAESLEHAIRRPDPVAPGGRTSPDAIHSAMAQLSDGQALHRETGATHAAGWANWDGRLLLAREDIGRHNALDKLIGAMLRKGIDPKEGFALVTSRASYEMVQKAAAAGFRLLAALSAPTELAVKLAERSGLTLLGFVRAGRHVAYAHPERLA